MVIYDAGAPQLLLGCCLLGDVSLEPSASLGVKYRQSPQNNQLFIVVFPRHPQEMEDQDPQLATPKY